MADDPGRARGRSMFALGCAWAFLIMIVLLVLAFLWVWWQLGFIGPTD